jgi:hypothetical protein
MGRCIAIGGQWAESGEGGGGDEVGKEVEAAVVRPDPSILG